MQNDPVVDFAQRLLAELDEIEQTVPVEHQLDSVRESLRAVLSDAD